MMKTAIAGAVGLALMAFSGSAMATIIDFEDVAVASGANNIGGDRVSGGFSFDSSTNHTHLANDSFGASNGTTYLVTDDFEGLSTLTMSPLAGGIFGLAQLDMSEWNPGEEASQVRITGNLFGGGSIATTITLDGIFDGVGGAADFETFVLGWTNLTSVVFDGVAGLGNFYYAIDNLHVSVPEPGALALFGLGLAGLGFARRRRASA